jgi:hypothetical protein
VNTSHLHCQKFNQATHIAHVQPTIVLITSRAVDVDTKRDACLDRCPLAGSRDAGGLERQRWDDHRGYGAHATAQGSRLVPLLLLAYETEIYTIALRASWAHKRATKQQFSA